MLVLFKDVLDVDPHECIIMPVSGTRAKTFCFLTLI